MRLLAIAIGVVGVLVFAACGGGSDDSGGGGGGSNADGLPACPIEALTKATKPVNITFWHALTRANEEVLQQLTDRYNSSQSDVKVTLVNQIGYKENLEKYRAGLGGTDLPDVIQVEDTGDPADDRHPVDPARRSPASRPTSTTPRTTCSACSTGTR